MPMTNIPKYPVVDPQPEMGKVILNFHATDYLTLGGFASAGYLFGWFGARKPLKVYNSRFLLGIGLTAGLMYGIQNSTYRLIGLRPNESEVQAYGIYPEEKLAEYKARGDIPNVDLISTP
eukprot:gene6288-12732_t